MSSMQRSGHGKRRLTSVLPGVRRGGRSRWWIRVRYFEASRDAPGNLAPSRCEGSPRPRALRSAPFHFRTPPRAGKIFGVVLLGRHKFDLSNRANVYLCLSLSWPFGRPPFWSLK